MSCVRYALPFLHITMINGVLGWILYRLQRVSKTPRFAGSLRLEPASPALWSALGSTSSDLNVKQYAFSRALQLDPKHTPSWTALGRLYLRENQPGLASQCFTQARSHEPTAAIVWESMGALAGQSPSGGA